MLTSLYNNNWLQENGQITDISNGIIYSNSNRLQKSFIKDFVDISGSLVIRSGMIYNDYLANQFSTINSYLINSFKTVSISGLTISSIILSPINYHTSQINTISSYINNLRLPNYDNFINTLSGLIFSYKPYLIDSSYYNYVTISGVTISSFIYQPSLINYQKNQINTISSYINNLRLPNYDLYLNSLSGSIINQYNIFKPFLLDSSYYSSYTISSSISGSIIYKTLSNYIYQPSLINYHTNQLNSLSSYLVTYNNQFNNINLYLNSLSGSILNQYNIFQPFLLDSSKYFNYTLSSSISGSITYKTLSNYIYQPSLINYHSNQLNSLSSYLFNLKIPIYDNFINTLSSNILNQYNIITIQANQINTLSSIIFLYKPFLLDSSYYNLYTLSNIISTTISSTISGSISGPIYSIYYSTQYVSLSSFIYQPSTITYHSNQIINLSGLLSSQSNQINNINLYLQSISSTIYNNVALKNSYNLFSGINDFYAGVNIYGGNYQGFIDYTGVYGTYMGQNAANFEITNYGSNILITSPFTDFTNTYTLFKGGTNVNNYNSYFPYDGDGQNYITGNTNLRGGNVNINDGLLSCYNGLTVYNTLTLPINSINDNALSSNIATTSYVDNYILTLSSSIKNLSGGNINDSQLTSNIPKLDQTNTFTGTNTFKAVNTDGLTLSLNSNINQLGSGKLLQASSSAINVLSKTKLNPGSDLLFSPGVGIVDQSSGGAGAILGPLTMRANANIIFSSGGSGAIDQLGSTGSNKLVQSTFLGNITFTNAATITNVSGILTLPLSTDTLIGRATPDTLTNKILTNPVIQRTNGANTYTLTLPNTSNDTIVTLSNLTIYLLSTTASSLYATISSLSSYVTNSSLSTTLSSYVTNSSLSTNLSSYLTSATASSTYQPISSMSSYLTTATASSTYQPISSMSSYLTTATASSTYQPIGSYLTSASSIGDSQLSSNVCLNNTSVSINQYNSTNAVFTTLSQSSSTQYLIENKYNSSSIILRNKNASGVSIDHTFGFNRVSLGSFLQMGSNLDIIQQGTGKIDQGITTGTNLMSSITMNSNTNLSQSGTGIISQLGAGTNSFKGSTFSGAVTLQSNTTLPTTFSIPTSGHLGYIEPITYKNVTTFNLVSNTHYNIASITLNPGSYIITGQGGCALTTSPTVVAAFLTLSLSTTSNTHDNTALIGEVNNHFNNYNTIKQISRTVSITTQTTFYLVISVFYGAYLMSYNSTTHPFINLTAIRIG